MAYRTQSDAVLSLSRYPLVEVVVNPVVAGERYTVLTGSSTYHTLSTVSFLTILFNLFKGLTTNIALVFQILFTPLLRLLFRFCVTSYFDRLAPHSPNFENKYNFCILVYMEEWREVIGYEGFYTVSSEGTIKNNKGHIMKSFKKYKDKDYRTLVLCKNGVKKAHTVHSIVATAFPDICGEKQEGFEIDHIDGDASNNRAENLRYVSHTTNMQNPITKQRVLGHKRRKRVIEQLTMDGEYIRTWEYIKDAADYYGIYPSNISMVLAGKHSHANGFKWRYAS